MRRAALALCLAPSLALSFGLLAPSLAQAAPAEERSEQTEAAPSSRTTGPRVQVGALMLAHVRRVEESAFSEKEPGTLAPGGALGVVWRVEGWELGPTIRGAYFKERHFFSTRKTSFLSAGGRARWFVLPSSNVSPFLDFGVDLLAFTVDSASSWGPSAHGGAGLEIFHDHAHHRLRIDLGVDVPTFALDDDITVMSPACAGCGRSSSTNRIYIVPATVAATWTF